MRLSWSQPEDLVAHELAQSRFEGRDVTAVRDEWIAAGGAVATTRDGASPQAGSGELRELAVRLLDRIDATEPAAGAGPEAPAAGRKSPQRAAAGRADTVEPRRVLGAWLGRCAGCLVGKPVEKVPAEGIREILRSQSRWPLAGYFTGAGLDPAVAARWPWNRRSRGTSLAENIDGMPEDDDLNYTMLNLQLLESHGRDFTADDVADSWLLSLPAGRVFTAERVAYRNLLDGIEPERCATRRNPFREWIGALIRADVFGWTAPGDPALAARTAMNDARLSHTGNGVYGAMWVAAMSATAIVAGGVDEVVSAGLSVLPPTSRLASAIRFGDDLGRRQLSLEAALDALRAEFADLHWVHVVNNAAVIAWALRRGAGRFDEAVPLSVMAGWDTDSDGATVGALCGALAGADGLGDRWTVPLHDRIATSLPGMNGVSISGLADRTVALAARFGARIAEV